MHRSMKESEQAHKQTSVEREAKTRGEEEMHEATAARVHAHERATVPGNQQDGNAIHPAVKHSIGHYLERDGKSMGKRMRVLRHQRRHTAP